MPCVAAILRDASNRLGAEGRAEAEILLAHALQRSRGWLFAHAEAMVEGPAWARFSEFLERREAGEPVAYLVGWRGFWRFDLQVGPGTLIPRPETERLVELVLQRVPEDASMRLLDLGTGSGAIALALASERPLASIIAVERSEDALAMARANAASLGLATRMDIRQGEWFAPVSGERFAVIASNPPYIEADDPHLQIGDLRHEPVAALASGPDGLDDLRRIIAGAPAHLEPGGWLLVEHGWQQGEAVRELFSAAGFSAIGTECDLEARERVTFGRR